MLDLAVAMTLRYAHLAPDHKMSAVEKLDEALREQKKTVWKSKYTGGGIAECDGFELETKIDKSKPFVLY